MEVAKSTYSLSLSLSLYIYIYIYIYIYKAKLKIIRKKLRNNKKNEENYKTTIF